LNIIIYSDKINEYIYFKRDMMFDYIKKRVLNDSGAMDRILVTLLLVIVGVVGVIGLSTWAQNQEDSMRNAATSTVTSTTKDASGNSN